MLLLVSPWFASFLFGFHYGFHLFSWVLLRPPPFGFHYLVSFVSPSPRLCLVFTMGFVWGSLRPPPFGFHYPFRLVLLVSPSPRLCLVSFVLLRRVFVWFSLWVSSVVGSCVSIAGRTVMSHRRMRAQI